MLLTKFLANVHANNLRILSSFIKRADILSMGILKTFLLVLFVGLISFFIGRYSSNDEPDLEDDFSIEESAFDQDDEVIEEKVFEPKEKIKKSFVKEKISPDRKRTYDDERVDNESDGVERPSFFPTSKNNIAPVDNGVPIVEEESKDDFEEKRIQVGSVLDEADSEDLDRLAEQMPEDAERLREVLEQREFSDREAMDMSPELEAASDEIAPLSEEELRIEE